MSGDLAITQLTANQANKAATVNQATADLEAAIAGMISADVSAGNVTLTAAQIRRAAVVTVSTTGHNLILTPTPRLLVILNTNAAALPVIVGTTTISLATGGGLFMLDGTTNGLASIGLGGEGGGGGGATALADLTDVEITSPSNNQGLFYDSTAGKWKNKTLSSGAPVGGATDPHKAWRLNISATATNDGPTGLDELEFKDTSSGSNQSTNAGTPFASVTESGRSVANAYNGSTGLTWGAYPVSSGTAVKLGKIFTDPISVTSITIIASSDGYYYPRTPGTYTVEYSDDTTTGLDGTWTVAWTVTDTSAFGNGETRNYSNPSV